MSQAIGDNSLIDQILAARIAETPTLRVAEVEAPTLEEEVVQEEPSNTIDYTEYEEEPTPAIFLEEKQEAKSHYQNTEGDHEVKERKDSRRKISAKWGVQLYDQLQALIALFTYDKLNSPKAYINRRQVLLEKVYTGTIEKEEREELKKVNEIVDAFQERRSSFQENVHIAEDLKEDINELLDDILVVSKIEVNPVWILVVLMLIQPVLNLITCFTHKMQYNNRFNGI